MPSKHKAKEKRDEGYESSIFSHSFATNWRKALVSLPRMVPDIALRFTSPEGPQPLVVEIPCRDKPRLIPLYVFIPPQTSINSREQNTGKDSKPAQQLPVLLDFHGGGFILGSCQEQAPFCSKLCRDLCCVAISVDYRLGPYAKFPAAYHDAEDVLKAIIAPFAPGYHELRNQINRALHQDSRPRIDFDTSRIAISGFSSGGSLALNLALSISAMPEQELLPDEGWPSTFPDSYNHPIPLLLFYPALDTRLLPAERPLPAGMEPPTGFLTQLNLETELMPTYLPKHLTTHPRASPALVSKANGVIHQHAKFFLVLPEKDSLSPSSELWATKMIDENRGHDLQVERIPDMLHGWTQFPDSWIEEAARRAKVDIFEKTVEFVRKQWAAGQ